MASRAPAFDEGERGGQGAGLVSNNLYVRGLPLSWRDSVVEACFAEFGPVTSCRLLYHQTTGLSRGMGFIRFKEHSHAAIAMARLNGSPPPGAPEDSQPLIIKFAKDAPAYENAGVPLSCPADRDPLMLYIVDLPVNIQREFITSLYSPFPGFQSASLLMDPNTGASRGIALIKFSTPENALRAMKETQGKTLGDAVKPILVRFARLKEDRPRDADSGEFSFNWELIAAYAQGPLTNFLDPLRMENKISNKRAKYK